MLGHRLGRNAMNLINGKGQGSKIRKGNEHEILNHSTALHLHAEMKKAEQVQEQSKSPMRSKIQRRRGFPNRSKYQMLSKSPKQGKSQSRSKHPKQSKSS